MEDDKVHVKVFNGKHFSFWKFQITNMLHAKELEDTLEEAKPTDMDEKVWTKKNRQALGLVLNTLSIDVASHIMDQTTIHGLMKRLAELYVTTSSSNKLHLLRRLFHLKMAEGTLVTEHLGEFNLIVSELKATGGLLDDELLAHCLLLSMPDSWSTVIDVICGNSKVTLDLVRDRLVNEEIRRRERGDATGAALSVERGRKSQKGGGTIMRGHMKRDCKAPRKAKREDESNSVNAAAGDDSGDALVLCVDSPIESWVLDSGASFHSTSCKELIKNFVAGQYGTVYLADGKPLSITGKGDVHIKSDNGYKWALHDVRYIPGLKKNLISVGQLDKEGFRIIFGEGSWKIVKEALVVARGTKTSTLYLINSSVPLVAVAGAKADPNLWHKRLGHMSDKGMKVLASKELLPTMKSVEIDFCEDCVFGKQKRVSFSKVGRERKEKKLELVHTDVWGPAPVQSHSGSLYYVTFIDDSTRKVWVYFLKHKSDVFGVFKKWKAEVENESGCKLKSLRSDNGGEYDGANFKGFCAEHGVKLVRTVPNRPQQNGIAERMNRTLNKRARAMRLHAGLPKVFWAEAINTAAYLINRSPSMALGLELPQEKWSGKKVSLSHLKTFGSKDATFNENELYKERSKSHVEEVRNVAIEIPKSDDDATELADDAADVPEEEHDPQVPVLRRSTRIRRPNPRYTSSLSYLLLTDSGEPEDYKEAIESGDAVKWEQAMMEEFESLEKNKTWDLTKLPEGKRALQSKWVFRVKDEVDGSKRYKARLVVKGFMQKKGIDYTEVFSPVVKLTTIRMVLGFVATENLHLEQLDVKTTFLHGDLEEEIYMVQPEGFEIRGKEGLVCKLKKSLYGLKQAPRQWYKKFDKFMCDHAFKRSGMDHCCYFRYFGTSFVILLLYVDDMLIARNSMKEINNLKQELAKEFEMKDLGPASQILGMRISRDRAAGTLILSQEKYINKVLERFRVQDAKPRCTPLGGQLKLSKAQAPKTDEERDHMAAVPYASAIGSLMYAMVCTRPDISQAVGVLSRFMANPGMAHWEAVKWLLRYLKGTSSMALCFKKSSVGLEGFVDADLGGDMDNRKSTSGYVFTWGGTAISWMSRLQKCVALSTTEAEYVAISEAGKEMVWLLGFLKEIGKDQGCGALHTDSQSALYLAKNPVFHSRTKHIQLKYHYIREVIEDGTLSLKKIVGAENPADMLTKVVTTEKLRLCCTSVGLVH
ncbi:Transposon Ty1-NL2 Gag-Pol polyprotein [Rhynchospora pubera]|uniref:Transposon Ty1-NL2 Gag-Pol polyprotein n=1 Tax=Rhynchospora pubera TaxID=906938 RepID=A0AAV8B048_9POAL|nr:Transposon Ty1-NL2 Gag-Pol polyprotein [Rhynchospora pubera]